MLTLKKNKKLLKNNINKNNININYLLTIIPLCITNSSTLLVYI